MLFRCTFTVIVALYFATSDACNDVPCMPRSTNNSIVCVCNATYCDTVTREVLNSGTYISYTSSDAGLRFSRNTGPLQYRYLEWQSDYFYDYILELLPNIEHQTIEGFGGAVTDSAGINWKSLPEGAQQHLINSYCSENGLEYNMLRVPCGSTDFSLYPWTYNEYPANDLKLTNFTLSSDDINYKVPMVQACMKVSTANIEVVSTTWSPPSWMLSKESLEGFRSISPDYQQVFADYYCKFAELYKEQGINIWGLAVANEPLNGISNFLRGESTLWPASIMETFLTQYFTPTIRNCSVEGIKILGVEDLRYTLPFWTAIFEQRGTPLSDYIDGVSTHFYDNLYTSPGVVTRSLRNHPNIFAISTEASIVGKDGQRVVNLGSWDRAKKYIVDILENLNFDFIGWLDWNMCLDATGGPSWLNNNVDSPVIVNAEKGEFYKQPLYYALGHFAKFIPRGSKRIGVLKRCFTTSYYSLPDVERIGQNYYDNVAFKTPQGTIVVVLHNEGSRKTAAIRIGIQQISIILDEESITTVEIFI